MTEAFNKKATGAVVKNPDAGKFRTRATVAYLIPLKLTIFSLILIPHIRISSIPAFRVDQVIVVVAFAVTLFLGAKNGRYRLDYGLFPALFLMFAATMGISIVVGMLSGIDVIAADFFEFYKIFIYLGVYLMAYRSIRGVADKYRILDFMLLCLVVSCIIAIQQYFDLFNLNDLYVRSIAPTQFRTLVDGFSRPRAIGMTSNPNEFSVMLVIGAIIAWSQLLRTQKTRYLFALVLFPISIILTGSRSGLVVLGVGLASFMIMLMFTNLYKKNGLYMVRLLSFGTLFLIAAAIVLTVLPESMTDRFQVVVDPIGDRSFVARFVAWEEHIEYFRMSPLFGLGPAKSLSFEKAHVDNEWILLLRRYGAIGSLAFLMALIFPFLRRSTSVFNVVYFSVLTACVVHMIPAEVFSSFQTMPIVLVLAALTKPLLKEHAAHSYTQTRG